MPNVELGPTVPLGMSEAHDEPQHLLIVTHEHADFDAFASQVAAAKLHQGAHIVLPNSVGREVHPYLALHRDRFAGLALSHVRFDEVRELVIVDVRSKSRLRHIEPLLERKRCSPSSLYVRVYDHHPARSDDVVADDEVVAPVGSALTLLMERLDAGQISIDPIEATLFALGLFSDTGSFTFPSTTARDAAALARLLGCGANLRLVSRYLHAAFKAEQRRALADVLSGVELLSLGGLRVGCCGVTLPASCSGLDEVTTRALEVLGYHALFCAYQAKPGRVQLIGRSSSEHIDVAAVLAPLGGGGHATAGAGVAKGRAIEDVVNQLRGTLSSLSIRATTARDVMSSPVHSVAPTLPLAELRRTLAAWGHTGACVVSSGRLVGVVSQRDVRQAEEAGRDHLPVSAYMSHKLFTAEPQHSLEQLLRQMETEDVGRLPVLEGGRLLGIVTRSDVLAVLYASG